MSKSRYVSKYYLVEICAGLGEADEAMAWLEKAYEERRVLMICLIGNPKFIPLPDDPRFEDLAHRVGWWNALARREGSASF